MKFQLCRHRHKLKLFAMFMLAVIVTCPSIAVPEHALSKTPNEYQVKAAFIYNFTRFIEWPDGTFPERGGLIKICIVGEDPFKDSMSELENKKAKGMGFEVRRVRNFTGGDTLEPCNIIFIGKSETQKLPAILRSLEGKNILTISDIKRFAEVGGVIGFATKKNKIRLEVNLKAANHAKLDISSKLLKLVDIVDK